MDLILMNDNNWIDNTLIKKIKIFHRTLCSYFQKIYFNSNKNINLNSRVCIFVIYWL